MRAGTDSQAGRRKGPRTVFEAGEELGLSPHTVRAWIAAGRIEYHRLGRAIRISQSEVARLLDESTVPRSRRRQ